MEIIKNQSFTIHFTNMDTMFTQTDEYNTAEEATAEFWRLMPKYVEQGLKVRIVRGDIDDLHMITARITDPSAEQNYIVELNLFDREYARYTINEMFAMVYRMGLKNPSFEDLEDYLKGSSFSHRWDADDMCYYFERPLTSLDTAE